MDIKQLIKFLVKAKISTYASSGEERGKILEDGSKEFELKEGILRYRDRYFGYNPFYGQEIVFQKDIPLWGMNYYGKIISKRVLLKNVYKFLQSALKKVKKSYPFRGPKSFKKGNFKYTNKVKGTIKKFEGEETIFFKGEVIFRLIYHGGIIISK